MDKYFKVSLISNLILIVIIITIGVLFEVGTFSLTEETKKFFLFKFFIQQI